VGAGARAESLRDRARRTWLNGRILRGYRPRRRPSWKRITEVAPDVYRISTFHPEYGLQFNQYLVKDDEPFLMHTLMRGMFAVTREAIASSSSLLAPLDRLQPLRGRRVRRAEPMARRRAARGGRVCGFLGANVTLADCADRPARVLADDEVLKTGRHRLQYLATPHVPHCWDAGLFFEVGERTLLCSDLFFHSGRRRSS
jgi:hypothetical protein